MNVSIRLHSSLHVLYGYDISLPMRVDIRNNLQIGACKQHRHIINCYMPMVNNTPSACNVTLDQNM